jgi:RNA polymerase sigma-70 factor (ECF subfamily)
VTSFDVPSPDDAALLRSYASRGDAVAFAELVRRYADLVYATARRVTGSAAAAEDVAQDCFFALAIHSKAIRGSVAAWLHRTSLNRSLEVLRAERARKRRETEVAEASDASTPPQSDSAQIISLVDEAIAELPDDLRVAVTEHFLCGRSQVELAASRGVSQSTISRRVDAGLARIRERLNKRGIAALSLLALPMMLSDAARAAGPAPVAVRAAVTKIGLSGVGSGSAVSAGAGALAKLAAALVVLVVAVAGVVGLIRWTMPPAATGRQVTLPAEHVAATTSQADDDDVDDDGPDADEARRPAVLTTRPSETNSPTR